MGFKIKDINSWHIPVVGILISYSIWVSILGIYVDDGVCIYSYLSTFAAITNLVLLQVVSMGINTMPDMPYCKYYTNSNTRLFFDLPVIVMNCVAFGYAVAYLTNSTGYDWLVISTTVCNFMAVSGCNYIKTRIYSIIQNDVEFSMA